MVLGLDIGTTGVKALALGDDGEVLSEGQHAHDLLSPHPGWAEERPSDWWQGALHAVTRTLSGRPGVLPRSIGVSGMVPAAVFLDASGQPIRASIQQNDARATTQIAACRQRYADDELFEHCGNVWNQQVLPPKLLWVREHEPDLWTRLHRLSGAYEYVTYRLTGSVYAEANWSLESGIWDMKQQRWNDDLLTRLELRVPNLPAVRRPHDIVGTVTDQDAADAGLPRGTPVIAGSADHIAAALGVGLRQPGDVVLKFGGAGDLLYVVRDFAPVRELFIDYHDLPGLFVLNGCMATSGSLVKWFRDHFRPGWSFADLDHEASGIPCGSDGLIVLPYFLGEKTPLHDPDARGTVIGLTLAHTPAHLFRAILEGVAYAFRHHVDVLEAAGHSLAHVYVTDGGARSTLWRTITASVLGRDVHLLEGGHAASAYGTALLAGIAAGLWDWSNFPTPNVATVTAPDPVATSVYRERYEVYRETYRRCRDLYPKLSARPA